MVPSNHNAPWDNELRQERHREASYGNDAQALLLEHVRTRLLGGGVRHDTDDHRRQPEVRVFLDELDHLVLTNFIMPGLDVFHHIVVRDGVSWPGPYIFLCRDGPRFPRQSVLAALSWNTWEGERE